MSEFKNITIESEENDGKIVFAEDVVATIATLAAAEVDGVYGMSGSAFEGIGEKLASKIPVDPRKRPPDLYVCVDLRLRLVQRLEFDSFFFSVSFRIGSSWRPRR